MNFRGSSESAFDGSIHVALPAQARVFSGKENAAEWTSQPLTKLPG